jgi:hypothetical protein
MVVDGGPSYSELPDLDKLLPLLPRNVVFHALMMGTEAEVRRGSSFYRALAARLQGSFSPVLLPQDTGSYKRVFSGSAPTTDSKLRRRTPFCKCTVPRSVTFSAELLLLHVNISRGFSELAAHFYQPFAAALVCGHMRCGVSLHPDPNLGRSVPPDAMHPAFAAEAAGAGDGAGATSATAVSVVSVRGFIPRSSFVSASGGVEAPQVRKTPLLQLGCVTLLRFPARDSCSTQVPIERMHVLLPDARGAVGEAEGSGRNAGGENYGSFLSMLLQARARPGLGPPCAPLSEAQHNATDIDQHCPSIQAYYTLFPIVTIRLILRAGVDGGGRGGGLQSPPSFRREGRRSHGGEGRIRRRGLGGSAHW